MPIPERWLAPSPPMPVDELGGDSLAEDGGERDARGVPTPETGAAGAIASNGSQRHEGHER
jgi:hypothetical protein